MAKYRVVVVSTTTQVNLLRSIVDAVVDPNAPNELVQAFARLTHGKPLSGHDIVSLRALSEHMRRGIANAGKGNFVTSGRGGGMASAYSRAVKKHDKLLADLHDILDTYSPESPGVTLARLRDVLGPRPTKPAEYVPLKKAG